MTQTKGAKHMEDDLTPWEQEIMERQRRMWRVPWGWASAAMIAVGAAGWVLIR